jgi:hypothetical protein
MIFIPPQPAECGFKPAKSKVLAFCKRIGELVKSLNGAKQEQIIFHLNPILRGFANYYRGGVSKEVFNYVDHRVWQYLWRWAKRRHPRKSTKWIKDKYFHQIGIGKWVFAHKSKDRRDNPFWLKLYGVASTPIVRHIKVKGKASPDNPDLREYWVNRNKRMGKIRWSKGSKYYIIAQDQDWTCPICGEPLLNGENLEIHHIVPVKDGGRDDTHNLSRSWVPNETDLTADFVKNGGHGTRVAGAVLYPNLVPTSGQQQAVCWLQNARVLDRDCRLSKSLFPPVLISNIVKFYQGERGTRIFNHSIAGSTPCRTQYMSAWAAEIDNLSWEYDILFIVAAGNLPIDGSLGNSRLSIRDRLQQGKLHPDYLLSDSCRVPNPAQSFQALTVGSVSLRTFRDLSRKSIAPQDYPSQGNRTCFVTNNRQKKENVLK